MKKYLLFIAFFIPVFSFATKWTISTSGFTFSPANTEITQGDTIIFNVAPGHTATEVSQSTWNANGTSASGAFNFSDGNNQQVTGLSVGIHYFVCQNHVSSMGMKGTITVNLASGVKNKTNDDNLFSIVPNPTKDYLVLKNNGIIFNKITITNIEGKIVKEITPDKNMNEVSIMDLPNGTYLFSAYTKEDEVYIRKFTKE